MLTGRLLDVSTADIDMEVRPGVGPSPGLSFEAVSLAPKPHRFIVVGFTITLARSRRLGAFIVGTNMCRVEHYGLDVLRFESVMMISPSTDRRVSADSIRKLESDASTGLSRYITGMSRVIV